MALYHLSKYKQVERTTSSPRDTEARVLNEAARRLEHCRDHWDDESRPTALDDALKYNQRLWTVLQAAVHAPDCPLPPELRVNILKISAFIDRQIFSLMAEPTLEGLTPIIDINRGLAQGLSHRPPRDSAARPIQVRL
jgi:flagellar protein FlaF